MSHQDQPGFNPPKSDEVPSLGYTVDTICKALEPHDEPTRRRIIESVKILLTDREPKTHDPGRRR